MKLFSALLNDEAGFVISAELVFISTIVVIGLVVGMSEIAFNINEEYEDTGAAVGAVNQSYFVSGSYGHKGFTVGSRFGDETDFCDSQFDIRCDAGSSPELPYIDY